MALLQFINSGCKTAAVPTTVHCDHLILAETGADEDLKIALSENKEVYDFLESVSNKYGIGFWKPETTLDSDHIHCWYGRLYGDCNVHCYSYNPVYNRRAPGG